MNLRIILAGGSGFLGTELTRHLLAQKHSVAILTRSPRLRTDGATETFWDAKSPGPWTSLVDGADVLVNLTGRPVNCRHTEANRALLMSSRVDSTRLLGEVIAGCVRPPRVWLNASSAAIYPSDTQQPVDEAAALAEPVLVRAGFLGEVTRQWELALFGAPAPKTRKVALRITLVLGRNGGVFPVLRRLARFGLAGSLGGGMPYVSWIHLADFLRAVDWIMTRTTLDGPVNLAAPNPVRNSEQMRALRAACSMPIGLPATDWMIRVGAFLLRTEPGLLLESSRVLPGRLLASGFEFQYPELSEALSDLLRPSVS